MPKHTESFSNFMELHKVFQGKTIFKLKRNIRDEPLQLRKYFWFFSISSSSSFSFIHLHHSCLLLSCVFAWGLNPLPKWTHTHTTHADLIMYTHTDPACYSCLYGTHERCTRGFSLTTKKWRPKQKCNTYNNKKKGTSPSILKKK